MVGAMGNTDGRIAEEFSIALCGALRALAVWILPTFAPTSHGRAPWKERRVRHIDDEWLVCRCCRGQAQSAQERCGKDARGFGAELLLFVP